MEYYIKQYPIAFEISGRFGMFADSLTGSEGISHALPTPTAIRGMIESIIYQRQVHVKVIAVATCNMPNYISAPYNSKTSLRVQKLIKSESSMQTRESVLYNPCFQILALLSIKDEKTRPVQQAHSMQMQFFRRLKRGQSYAPVCLGRKEMLASYFGKQITPVESRYCAVIPSMITNFNQTGGNDEIKQRLIVKDGILSFEDDYKVHIGKDGMLEFVDGEMQEKLVEAIRQTSPRIVARQRQLQWHKERQLRNQLRN